MGIDELVYNALAPRLLKDTMENLRELPVPAASTRVLPKWKGVGFRAMLAAITVMVCTLLATTLLIVPRLDDLWDAADALCGCRAAVVFGSTNAGFTVWVHTTAVNHTDESG